MAGELISKRPDASLRQIAKAVGISPGTARNVRDRLRRGDDPTLPTHSGHEPSGQPGSIAAADVFDGGAVAVISTLRGDPALRSSASGRALLRLLEAVTIRPEREAWLIKGVPPHCVGVLAAAARGCAKFWLDFAAQLETRHQQTFEQRPDDERIKVG